MSDWQPIETAPYGISILIGRVYTPAVIQGNRIDDDLFVNGALMRILEPTHWQPLPNPPEDYKAKPTPF